MSTGNTERMRDELDRAAATLQERYPCYREHLVAAAMDCITTTAEHDDRRTNINQRFDSCLEEIAKKLTSQPAEDQQ